MSDGVVRGVHGHIVRLVAGRIRSGQLAESNPVPNHRWVVDKLRARDDFTEACAG